MNDRDSTIAASLQGLRARRPLPDWQVSRWFNADRPLQLADLRGRVVLVHVFQMFCPGCVQHALPQAERIQRALAGPELAVVGLHSAFEHHDRATDDALATFLQQQQITHPIGVDRREPGRRLPRTLSDWSLSGTPSLLLLDREGLLQGHRFGMLPDREVRGMIRRLIQGSSG